MKYYFIDDDNGQYLSDDGKRRFSRLAGGEIMAFFASPRGKGVRFMEQVVEDDGDMYMVEIPRQYLKEYRQDERRQQYVRDIIKASGYITIPYNTVTGMAGEEEAEEIAATEFEDIEDSTMHQVEMEMLRKALDTLSETEMELLNLLYLGAAPMTEREVSDYFGLAHTTINYRKKIILKKLQDFFVQNDS